MYTQQRIRQNKGKYENVVIRETTQRKLLNFLSQKKVQFIRKIGPRVPSKRRLAGETKTEHRRTIYFGVVST